MNDILMCAGAAGVFFGAMALRGIFGYLKNKKIAIEDLRFDWKKFLSGSLKPILLTLAIGGLAALILAFLSLVDASGVEVQGIDQISIHNLLIGLFIADIGAIGYAIKEALLAFGLSEKQIAQIREAAEKGETGLNIGMDEDGNLIASVETKTDKSVKEILNSEAEDGEVVDHGVELNPGKGAAWVNTYPEPYRSAAKDSLVDPSTCYSRECVSYVAWKIKEVTGAWPKRTGNMNAKEWIYRLPSWGYKKVSAPKNGGCYVGVLTSGTYGHVVWFEGDRTISEYNYGSAGNYGVRQIVLSQYNWYEIKAPTVTPTPTPGKKSNDEIANEVIKGLWGNGDARKKNLQNAGYDYNTIQNLVNKKLGGGTSTTGGVKLGDKVKTSATKDRSGVNLNLRIINDGQSVWASSNGDWAILKKGNVIRCSVPKSSLRKA